MAFPLGTSFRNTTVFATPLSEPISSRSRSRTLCDSGSQTLASLVMGSFGALGVGPDHLTVPVMVPPSSTLIAVYSDCAEALAAQKIKRDAAATSLRQKRCVAVFITPHNGRTRNVLMNSSWNSDSAVHAPLRDCEMWLSCDEVERREIALWAISRAGSQFKDTPARCSK